MFKAVQNSLLSLIYPQQCRVCSGHAESRDDGVACSECWAATRLFDGTQMLCRKCGALFAGQSGDGPSSCQICSEHFYDRAVAAGVYEKALAASIINLKRDPFLPGRARSAIKAALQRADLPTPDVIVPVPLSKQREIERGFNQARIIAGAAAHVIGAGVDELSLARKIHTPIHRIGMDRKAREITVKNAFQVLRPKLIDGKNILLVDDVLTSGATASACAKVLKKSGALRVNVFTVGRAVMD